MTMYADYLRESNSLLNHKHMQSPDAQPPVATSPFGSTLSGVASFRNTPKQQEAIRKRAEKAKTQSAPYIRNEVVRAIQEDLRLA